jgi:hypothetical protein
LLLVDQWIFCKPASSDPLLNQQVINYPLALGSTPFALEDKEESIRSKRTGPQWRARIEAQLNLRADFFLAAGRFDQDRTDYLDAVALVRDAEFRSQPEQRGLHIVLPAARPARRVPARESALAKLPVKVLVARLMSLDGTLTCKRTLSHLSKEKLAHMIFEREFARSAHDTWEAQA